MVRFVDRPPLILGQGPLATVWYAIMPGSSEVRYIRADSVRLGVASPHRHDEILAVYEPDEDGGLSHDRSLPAAGLNAEIERIESIHHAIVRDQPIHQWRFEAVRSGYQALLKRSGGDPVLEESIRGRLHRVTQHEQAAEAARTIREILAKSHRRDQEIAEVERRRWPGRYGLAATRTRLWDSCSRRHARSTATSFTP